MYSSKYISNNVISSPIPDCYIPDEDIWTFTEKGLCGHDIAFLDSSTQASITYRQFRDKLDHIAANLIIHGFNPKIPLSLYMNNSIEYLLIAVAVWRLGGTVALINSTLSVREIKNNLNILSSEFLCCDELTVKNAKEAAKDSNVKKILINGDQAGCIPISTLYDMTEENISIPNVTINPREDVAAIIFSSGTTGLPKAVELTHRSCIGQLGVMCVTEMDLVEDCSVIYQPFSHLYGIYLCIFALACGKKAVIMPKFDLAKYISLCSEYESNTLFFVPPIAVMFAKSNLADMYDLTNVRIIFCSAAPLSKVIENEIIQMLGHHVQIRQAYGLTESSAAGTIMPSRWFFPDEPCPDGSVGLPMCTIKIKVIDLATGQSLPPGKEGEILIKGSYMMKGYKNNRKATDEMLSKDGWLHSGDIGYYDNDGYLFVVDRLKELIKYKGKQVAPAELEGLLLSHPAIADAGVTSVPDLESGELPMAWVVKKPNVTITENDVKQFISENAAPYKRLRGGVKFVAEIPKSPSGKILRREIKRLTLANFKSKV